MFRKDGTVTAGNASGINDGAAAVVLMERSDGGEARREADGPAGGLRALPASIRRSWASARFRRRGMALQRAGLALADIDVIESNEAFAAQACAVAKDLGFDPAKTNPNGSGISLGHPVGATGTILAVKALYELERIGGRYALVTMCIGGGQGIAAIFERV